MKLFARGEHASLPREHGMRRKKPPREEASFFLLTSPVDREFHPSLLTIARDRFDVGAFPFSPLPPPSFLLSLFFSFARSNKFPSSRFDVVRRRRNAAAPEQRTHINNPEFPANVLIIRFQGPPILAGSYARKRIVDRRSRSVSELPFSFTRASSSPSLVALAVTAHFHPTVLSFFLSLSLSLFSPFSPVSSSISSARFLFSCFPSTTGQRALPTGANKEPGNPTPCNTPSVFMAENLGTAASWKPGDRKWATKKCREKVHRR